MTEKMILEFDLTDYDAKKNAERALKSEEICDNVYDLLMILRNSKKFGNTELYDKIKSGTNFNTEQIYDILEILHAFHYELFQKHIHLIEE